MSPLTLLFLVYFFLSSAVLVCISGIICLVTAPFDPARRAVHAFSCWWGYHYVQINPFWKCTFEGLEHIDPSKTYVLAANHQSYWDIMVLYGLHRPFKWVSKDSVFKVPFIGWNMMLNQYVKLFRGDLKSIKEMLSTCKNWLKKGSSIMIFPEGTRSPDGELGEFRDGPFKLAVDTGVPVIPIVVDGTQAMFPKDSLVMSFSGRIKVRVLPPLYAEDFGGSARKMREHAHKLMKETLDDMRGRSKVSLEV